MESDFDDRLLNSSFRQLLKNQPEISTYTSIGSAVYLEA